MTLQAQIVLVVVMPIATYFLFARYPTRTALLMTFLGAYLFLPRRTGFVLPLLPDFTEMTAVSYVALIAILLFDGGKLRQYQWHWLDLPLLIWCVVPLGSSLINGLGFYDGLGDCFKHLMVWGVPYGLGRLYLNSLTGMKEFALLWLKGALIYVPLCLWEVRMSPQLHNQLYGFFAHNSGVLQALRSFGLWRPMVFMNHGLFVASFMFSASLLALWLWQSGSVTQIWGQPIRLHVVVLFLTFLLLQSANTYFYMFLAIAILIFGKFLKTNIPVLMVATGIFIYLVIASTGNFDGSGLVDWIAQNMSAERANSLGFRFDQEVNLIAHAQKQWLWGWGGWARNEPELYTLWGSRIRVVIDSFWIIAFGVNGILGLVSIYTTLVLPGVLLMTLRYPARLWFYPQVGPAIALSVCSLFVAIDSLFNAAVNPLNTLVLGGVVGLVIQASDSLDVKGANPVSSFPSARRLHPRG